MTLLEEARIRGEFKDDNAAYLILLILFNTCEEVDALVMHQLIPFSMDCAYDGHPRVYKGFYL